MSADERMIAIDNLKKLVKYRGFSKGGPCAVCVQTVEMAIKAFEEPIEDFETAYMAGYEYGYKMAIKDMEKKIKELKSYGGDYKKERAAGVPEHHASGAGGDEQKL